MEMSRHRSWQSPGLQVGQLHGKEIIVNKSCGELSLIVQCKTCTFGPAKNSNFKKLKVYETKYVCVYKVNKILKISLDLIPSPLPSVKIKIMGRKVCLRCRGKTLLGIVNKLLKTKRLASPSNVLPYYLK
jgi:hypothetical protein